MERCVVIQPFDKGKFDKRYNDVFAPAIKAAGYQPYRVDEDYSADIPIDQVHEQIQRSSACLAEITLDNPNVWYELGYAIARQIPICLVCSMERTTKYPFDIQHRKIVKYYIESRSDFDELGSQITKRLKAIKAKSKEQSSTLRNVAVDESSGLRENEIAVLRYILAGQIDSPAVSGYVLRREMGQTHFDDTDVGLALSALQMKGLIHVQIETDINGEAYRVYMLTGEGQGWIEKHKESFPIWQRSDTLREEPMSEDDIPF